MNELSAQAGNDAHGEINASDFNYATVRRILLAINKLDGIYYLFARHAGVNENTLSFLYALDDGLPHSQKEISDEWLIPRTTINSIVKNMLAQGYIAFDETQHHREKAITLTEKGQAYTSSLLGEIYTAEERAIIGTLERFSPEFVDAIEHFSQMLAESYAQIPSPDTQA